MPGTATLFFCVDRVVLVKKEKLATIGMLNQLLKGDSNSYYIDLSIYNSSSGELVSKGNTKDGITWNIGE